MNKRGSSNKLIATSIILAMLLSITTVMFTRAFGSMQETEKQETEKQEAAEHEAAEHEAAEVIVSDIKEMSTTEIIEVGMVNTSLTIRGTLQQPLDIQFEKLQEMKREKILEDEVRKKLIGKKLNSFKAHKKLKESDIIKVEPVYDKENKMFIGSQSESLCLDIREKSNWTESDFYSILNPEMHDLVPVAIRLEKEVGINAIYIIAVGASETGWGKHMAGRYNYFNWTSDGIEHFNFESIEDFSEFSVNTYRKNYIRNEFYKDKLGFIPEYITPEVVNVRYAINHEGGTNWNWSNIVSEIMSSLCNKREKLNTI